MFRRCSLIIITLAWAGVACAQDAPGNVGNDDPRVREVSALAARPDSWVLAQVGGERIVLDGQTLDLRMQYLFHIEREAGAAAPEPVSPTDPLETPDSRAAIREAANQRWIRHTLPAPELDWVRDAQVSARDGQPIGVRIYRPHAAGTLPVLVYYHGGGWLFGDLDAVDRSMRRLADEARVLIVSVDYRLAPEHPYPGSWNDAEDAFDWAVANVAPLGGDASRICVGGDSAGGNLSVVVTRRTQSAGKPAPACQLLYYAAVDNRPVSEMRVDYASARLFWNGFGLDEPFTAEVHRLVFPGGDLSQPEISPLRAGDVSQMPPTLVAAAGFDPLRDSDRAYAQALERAGVETVYLEYPSLAHGFMQHTALTPEADRAAGETADAFGKLIHGLPAVAR